MTTTSTEEQPDPRALARTLLLLVREQVEPRFALTPEEFVEHLLDANRGLHVAPDPFALARSLQLDDLYLAAACLRQDEAAWAECARRHFGFMRDFATRFLRRDAAKDLTDAVIADLWQRGKLARYDGRSSLRTWLGAVTAHAALNASKLQGRSFGQPPAHRPAPFLRTAGGGRPEQREASRLLSALLAEAMEDLRAEDRLILLLHFEQGLALDRMAPLLDTSKATLSRRLKRIREGLRLTLERLTHERYRASTADFRKALDLGEIEFDLSRLLGNPASLKESGGGAV